MKNQIFKTIFLISVLIAFGCNNSDEQSEESERQQFDCLSIGLQNGVVAFYPFNNGSLNDESVNSNNLTNTTTAIPTMDRNGNANCAFNFVSANDEYLDYANPTFLDDLPLNDFSISFWYKANSDFGYANFISRDLGNNCAWTVGQWSVQFVDEALLFGANGVAGVGHHIDFTNWEHIVLTVVDTDLKFYKNGNLSAEEVDFYNCDLPNPTLNEGDLFIGKFFDGQMDDIIIYNRELSTSEITELYNLSPCCN